MSKKIYMEKTSEIRIGEIIIFIKGNDIYVDKTDKQKVFVNGIEVAEEAIAAPEQKLSSRKDIKNKFFTKIKEVMN